MAGRWNRWDDDWEFPRGSSGLRRAAVAVSLLLAYALGVWTGGTVFHRTHSAAIPAPPPPDSADQMPANNSSSSPLPPDLNGNVITRIYRSARPSVFTITAVTTKARDGGPGADIGTGFLIDHDGDIATNNHVVSGFHTVSVTVNDTTYKGTVIGTDPLDDLAIVRIPPPPGIQPLPLGTSKTLQPGDLVVAIGNPFELTASVTAGIISGLNRSMPTDSGRVLTGLLQTDAALNPGNSGGPLLNARGEVVGINTAIESPVEGSVGIGFAIPIDRLKQELPLLRVGKAVQHPWLGIVADDITPELEQALHLPVSQGVLVRQVVKGGPAAKAGLIPDTSPLSASLPKGDGDVITAVNGRPVGSVADLTSAISQYPVGTVVHLTVLRHGKTIEVDVKLGNWNQRPQ
ncbi:MAG: trypsin-like peptidase domain-containing protein [Alicyclobacillaceae bacterium]|nr:trypsin-like peptidase domain-containing protein [Alicyclobacillaceae bacterium]